MAVQISESDHIISRDGVDLGMARHLYHRRDGIAPKLKLYATYVQTRNMKTGEDYFVPTDFCDARDADGNVYLTVDFETVQHETWTRMPDFVAHADADVEHLVPGAHE